eukprot:c23583_g1_i2 orf=733-1935(+)
MAERRLRNIRSHLSPCSPNFQSNSKPLEQREKRPLLAPDNTCWHPHQFIEEQKAHRLISKSSSSLHIFESRQSGFVEKTTLRGTVLHPIMSSCEGASLKELPSHSSIQKCGGLLRSTAYSSKVVVDPPSMYMKDVALSLKTNVVGYSSGTTGLTAPEQCSTSTHFHSVCPLPDAEASESSMQCSSFDSNEVLADGIWAEQVNHTASDILMSSEEQNLLTSRSMCASDSQPGEAGIDVSGSMTLSINNVMTGQRRHIVEDCIFCLIVQGQSPAFKLYEDEMCFCILDVHPLSHGHSLLIPKAHFPSLELTPPEVAAAMCATVPFISMAIMQATNCDSFNLLVNSGKAAGQVVFHTHFHIIPRRSGDDLWRSEDGSRRALSVGHETALLVQQIRHNLSNKRL